MAYGMILKPSAQRQLERLPKRQQRRVVETLLSIQVNPRLPGSIKLAGVSHTYRHRVGDYRIVFELDDAKHLVYVTIIAHRREVYRDL